MKMQEMYNRDPEELKSSASNHRGEDTLLQKQCWGKADSSPSFLKQSKFWIHEQFNFLK